MTRVPEDTIGRRLPGETAPPAPRTRREARERYRTSERRQARGLPSTSTGARSLRQAAKPGASLGAGYLGLGAAVGRSVDTVALVTTTLVVLALGVLAGFTAEKPWYAGPLVIAIGLLAAVWVLRTAVRRLGGMSGDVLGAVVEVTLTAALACATLMS